MVVTTDTGKADATAADPSKSPLLEQVMGYSVSVPDAEPTKEGLPVIVLKGFDRLDVGVDAQPKIPPIAPVVDLADDDRFALATPAAGAAPKAMTKEVVGKARNDALLAWKSFKLHCSAGGAGRPTTRLVPLRQTTVAA